MADIQSNNLNIFQLGTAQLITAAATVVAGRKLSQKFSNVVGSNILGESITEVALHAGVAAGTRLVTNQFLLPEEQRPSYISSLREGVLEGSIIGGARSILKNRLGILSMASQVGAHHVGEAMAGAAAVGRYLNLGERRIPFGAVGGILKEFAKDPSAALGRAPDYKQRIEKYLQAQYKGVKEAFELGVNQKANSFEMPDLVRTLESMYKEGKSPETAAHRVKRSGFISAKEHHGAERVSLEDILNLGDDEASVFFGGGERGRELKSFAQKMLEADSFVGKDGKVIGSKLGNLAIDRYILKTNKKNEPLRFTDARAIVHGPSDSLRYLQEATQIPFVGISPMRVITPFLPKRIGDDFAYKHIRAGNRSYLQVTEFSKEMQDQILQFTKEQGSGALDLVRRIVANDPMKQLDEAQQALGQDRGSMGMYFLRQKFRSELGFLNRHMDNIRSIDDDLAKRVEDSIGKRRHAMGSIGSNTLESSRNRLRASRGRKVSDVDQSFAKKLQEEIKSDLDLAKQRFPDLIQSNSKYNERVVRLMNKADDFTMDDLNGLVDIRRRMFHRYDNMLNKQEFSYPLMGKIRQQVKEHGGLTVGSYYRFKEELALNGQEAFEKALASEFTSSAKKTKRIVGRTPEDQYLVGRTLFDEYGFVVADDVVADDGQMARLFYTYADRVSNRIGRGDIIDDLRAKFDLYGAGQMPSVPTLIRSFYKNLSDPRHGSKLLSVLEEGGAADPESRRAANRLIKDIFERRSYGQGAIEEVLSKARGKQVSFYTEDQLTDELVDYFAKDIVKRNEDIIRERLDYGIKAKGLNGEEIGKVGMQEFAEMLPKLLRQRGNSALRELGLEDVAGRSELYKHFLGAQELGYYQRLVPFDTELPNVFDLIVPFKAALMPEVKNIRNVELVKRDLALHAAAKMAEEGRAGIKDFVTEGAQELMMLGELQRGLGKRVTERLLENDMATISTLLQKRDFKEIFRRRTEEIHNMLSIEVKGHAEKLEKALAEMPDFAIIHNTYGLVDESAVGVTESLKRMNQFLHGSGVTDPDVYITKGSLGRFGRQFFGQDVGQDLKRILSRGKVKSEYSPDNYTNLTANVHFLSERLLRFLEPLGLGLSPELTRTPWETSKNLFLRRVLPAYALSMGVLYANDKMRIPGTGFEDGAFAGGYKSLVVDPHIAIRGLEDRLGITAGHRALAHTLPGLDKINQSIAFPFGGMPANMEQQELIAWYERGRETVRRGRWWLASSSPFGGGKIERFSENIYNRLKAEPHKAFMGEEYWRHNYAMPTPDNFFGLSAFTDALFNRDGLYHYENKFRYSRPTVLSGGIFDNVPIVGPFASATLGQIIKPTIVTHPEQLRVAMQTEAVEEDIRNRQAKGEIPNYVLARVPNSTGTKLKGRYLPVDPHLLAKSVVEQHYAQEGGPKSTGELIYGMAIAGGGQGGPGGAGGGTGGGPGVGGGKATGSGGLGGESLGGMPAVPTIGGLEMQTRMGGSHYGELAQRLYYQSTELSGIYGFYLNTALGMDEHVKRISTANYDAWGRRFYEQGLGGQFFLGYGTSFSELFRRVIPREKGQSYNPLPNDQPSWMVGSKKKFEEGDPYSKVPLGEERLPGPGWEALHPILPQLRGSLLGKPQADIEAYLRGEQQIFSDEFQETILERGTSMHRAFQEEMKKQGRLVKAEHAIYDEETGISGRIDAILDNGIIMDLKSTSSKILAGMTAPKPENVSQLNFYLHVMGKKRGQLWYQSREDLTQMKKFDVYYDPERLKRDLAVLERAKSNVLASATGGYGRQNHYELYSDVARLQILSDVAPESLEFLKLRNTIKSNMSKYSAADIQLIERTLIESEKRRQRYAFTPYRFKDNDLETLKLTVQKVLSPTSFIAKEYPNTPIVLAGLSVGSPETLQTPTLFKEGQVLKGQVAKELNRRIMQGVLPTYIPGINEELMKYDDVTFTNTGHPSEIYAWGPMQRVAGSIFESFSHWDTPLQNMFLRNRSAVEEYERSRVYGKDFRDWRKPIEDHIAPLANKLGLSNPLFATTMGGLMGGGFQFIPGKLGKFLEFSVGGGFVRERAARPYGALVGAAMGFALSMMHRVKDAFTDGAPIPEETKKIRDIEEYFDNLEYVKYKRLHEVYRYMAETSEDRTIKQAFKSESLRAKLKMGKTLRGLDIENASPTTMKRAFYEMDKPFFDAFSTAPEREKQRILDLLPLGERRVMQKLYGEKVDKLPSLDNYFRKHYLPEEDWEGWRPEVDLKAVKLSVVKSMNINPYNVDYFTDISDDPVDAPDNIYERGDRYSERDERKRIEDEIRAALEAHGMKNVRVQALEHGEEESPSVNLNVVHDRQEEVDQGISRFLRRWLE